MPPGALTPTALTRSRYGSTSEISAATVSSAVVKPVGRLPRSRMEKSSPSTAHLTAVPPTSIPKNSCMFTPYKRSPGRASPRPSQGLPPAMVVQQVTPGADYLCFTPLIWSGEASYTAYLGDRCGTCPQRFREAPPPSCPMCPRHSPCIERPTRPQTHETTHLSTSPTSVAEWLPLAA